MTFLVTTLVYLVPLSLLGAGLASCGWADRQPGQVVRITRAASLVSLLSAVAGALLIAAFGTLEAGFGLFSVYFDALSAILLPLVALIGAVVIRYSHNYLQGDPGQGHFLQWLALTLGAVLTLIVAGNLVLFTVAWIATSLCLHRLLVFYGERPGAVMAARKKFVISRVGDICLITAMILMYGQFETLDFATIFAEARTLTADSVAETPAFAWIGGLVVLSAAFKSAQFPFHSWLPEVMETPTPVSALMHAGIVNAGGFLVVRMSPLLVLTPDVLSVLTIVGAVTALFGSMTMLTQTSIKKALAFSTVGQMGFMMLQCGLEAFSSAILHIVAHGLYKAHAFLSSGSIVDIAKASWVPKPATIRHPLLLPLAFLCSLGLTWAVAGWFGITPESHHGILALGFILMLALTYLQWNAFDEGSRLLMVGGSLVVSLAVCCAYFFLQVLFMDMLESVVPSALAGPGPLEYAVTLAVVTLFALVLLIQVWLPAARSNRLCQAAYVHFYNGFYVSTLANRMLNRLWPVSSARDSTY